MKMQLKNKNTDEVLYTGTKQQCMHFLKCRKLDRQAVELTVLDNTPSYHTAVPVTEDAPVKTPFFKRIFGRE